jgi:hypothetical protein
MKKLNKKQIQDNYGGKYLEPLGLRFDSHNWNGGRTICMVDSYSRTTSCNVYNNKGVEIGSQTYRWD